MREYHIAAVQCASPDGNTGQALRTAEETIRTNAEKSELILFPEMSFTGFSRDPAAIWDDAPQITQTMRRCAAAYHTAVGFGYVERAADGFATNRYALYDSQGETILDTAKIHPFSYSGEHERYCGGDSIGTGVLNGLPVAAFVCYDLRFPELFRVAARSAHLIIVAANWLDIRHAHFQALLRARAIENQVYVLGLNCTGTCSGYRFLGGTALFDPEGERLCALGGEAGILYAALHDNVEQIRAGFSAQTDARFPLYAKLYQNIQ